MTYTLLEIRVSLVHLGFVSYSKYLIDLVYDTRMMCYRILAASYTDIITSLLFDPKGPTLKVISDIKVGNRPSWLSAHPDDPTLVFTGLEVSDGTTIALKFDEDGNGTIVGQIPSGGADPASLLATRDAIFVGNVRRHRQYPPSLRGRDADSLCKFVPC